MKKISIIIPVYNEEATISRLMKKVLKVKLPYRKEIIVVNDGSTDKTGKIIEKFKRIKIKIFTHKTNLGKGAAVKTALRAVTGDVVVIQDADLEYDPKDYLKLIKPIAEGKAEVVYGSRSKRLKKSKTEFLFEIGSKIVTWFTNLLYNTNITDEPTGYKVFKSSVLKSIKIKSNGFEWEPEVTAKIAKKGIKIYEVPISYSFRSPKEGKKIKIKDGFIAILTLIKYRFVD